MKKLPVLPPKITITKEIIEKQIGCGYCKYEKNGCGKYDPKVNKAKLGCEQYEHHLTTKTHD